MKKITLKSMRINRKIGLLLLLALLTSTSIDNNSSNEGKNFKSWEWKEVNSNASWDKRAGLQALYFNESFYVMGGRTPLAPFVYTPPVPGASDIWGDVWKSEDYGNSWTEILSQDENNQWPARAYFQALNDENFMYIIGGQNFNVIDNPECQFNPFCESPKIPSSDFFNDVWRSADGISWEERTSSNPNDRWSGRAGLSATMFKGDLYVMGGSFNDDTSIIGGPPIRKYYNDVWKSNDGGSTWIELAADDEFTQSRWSQRAGGVAVSMGDYMYMIGGEVGFTCPFPNPICDNPPYFNDVWRTKNGADWELVTANAEWSSRPGHQVVVSQDRLVLFGGFGLIQNPSDVWISSKGKNWKKVNDAPWNAAGSEAVKYDFDAVAVSGSKHKPAAIYTFGGDRETFDFMDFTNYLNVDNDVWKFSLPMKKVIEFKVMQNYPNPFQDETTFRFELPKNGKVKIMIYNSKRKQIANFMTKELEEGENIFNWEPKKPLKSGIYYANLKFKNQSEVLRILVN